MKKNYKTKKNRLTNCFPDSKTVLFIIKLGSIKRPDKMALSYEHAPVTMKNERQRIKRLDWQRPTNGSSSSSKLVNVLQAVVKTPRASRHPGPMIYISNGMRVPQRFLPTAGLMQDFAAA